MVSERIYINVSISPMHLKHQYWIWIGRVVRGEGKMEIPEKKKYFIPKLSLVPITTILTTMITDALLVLFLLLYSKNLERLNAKVTDFRIVLY